MSETGSPDRAADHAAAGAAIWSAERRQLTTGLVLTITLVAFEALAVATVMPKVKDDLGGLGLYGWVFSGFFLANLLGIVVAGQLADRHGLLLPYGAGLALFSVGLIAGGLAPSMSVLVAARLAQGFGAGAIPAVAYVAIGRGYPAAVRPRMFATISTAWVVPGLIGPAIASIVDHAVGWRFVFLGLVPIVVVAGFLAGPALASLGPPEDQVSTPERRSQDRARLGRVTLLVIGVGAALAAGTVHQQGMTLALLALGLPLAVWAFIGLVPRGTLRLAPGVPATIAVRGLLTCALFSADAYVPLVVVDGRGAPTWVGGLALSAASVTWATASWVQARLVHEHGPRRLDRIGFAIVASASALMLGVALGLPVGLAVLAWGFAGFGMGLAYAPLSATVLASAQRGQEGKASSSLQLSDTLGIALGTGIGGWIVAAGDAAGWAVADATAVVFVFSVAVAVGGALASGRLPARLPDGPAR